VIKKIKKAIRAKQFLKQAGKKEGNEENNQEIQKNTNSMNSPKIYFLKNSEGKFYNSKDEVFYSSIYNANYDRDYKKMQAVLKLPIFQNCSIHEITENDFMQGMAIKTTAVVLSGEYFTQLLKDLNYKLPTVSQVNKNMHKKCKIAIDELAPFSTLHKDFIKSKEDQTDEVQGHFQEYIETISKVEIYQCAEVTSILKAYFKDRNSILGITRKILNH